MRLALLVGGLLLLTNISAPLAAADDANLLTIYDEAGQPHPLGAKEISALPHRSVKAKIGEHSPEGTHEASFDGIVLADLLQSVGVMLGRELRGPRASIVVLVDAADGYRTVFALAELDPAVTDKIVLLADKQDGKSLDEKTGPLRLVIPDEKRGVRMARMVRTIRVANLKDFRPEAAKSQSTEPNK